MTVEVERWSPIKAWLYSLVFGSPKSNAAAIAFVGLGDGVRFLDIGCGPGAALEEARDQGAVVAGIDPSSSMVRRAARRVPEAEVKVGSAEEIPFPDNRFDEVINVSSFHHWSDRDAGLREAQRVLDSGGRLHVVERALDEGKDGHGLSPTEAEAVAARMREIGFADAGVDEIVTGRRSRYIVVTGSMP